MYPFFDDLSLTIQKRCMYYFVTNDTNVMKCHIFYNSNDSCCDTVETQCNAILTQ
jgi:hypothetical protein